MEYLIHTLVRQDEGWLVIYNIHILSSPSIISFYHDEQL